MGSDLVSYSSSNTYTEYKSLMIRKHHQELEQPYLGGYVHQHKPPTPTPAACLLFTASQYSIYDQPKHVFD
jgi:hypothetical protein